MRKTDGGITVKINGEITDEIIWEYNRRLAQGIVSELGIERSKVLLSMLKSGKIQ